MSTRHAIILLSGGLDSATALAVTRADGFQCHTLAFDYGQRHRNELTAAALISRTMGAIDHRVVAIDLRAIGGSALTANIDVPKDSYSPSLREGAGGRVPDSQQPPNSPSPSEGLGGRVHVSPSTPASPATSPPDRPTPTSSIPITYVPARNLTFLSIAAGYAEVVGASDIVIGVNAVDYSGYPDCRPEFIAAFEAAANLGTKLGVESSHANRLRVHAPLARMSKSEIITLGTRLGVDYSLTHSCYDPVPCHERPACDAPLASAASSLPTFLACGHCDSCILRRQGFQAAGVPDPTRYQHPENQAARKSKMS